MGKQEHTSEVGRRYAQALFDLAAGDAKTLTAVEADLVAFKGLVAESADLHDLLHSPLYGAEDKTKALAALLKGSKTHALVEKFLGLMLSVGRGDAVVDAITAFEHMVAAKAGVVRAEVTSAQALKKTQITALQKVLAEALGSEPEVVATVDPDMLGGLTVKVGSRMLDASLRTKLNLLNLAMKRA
jgi:F-type H+-transporting ATPase subunit delta